MNDSNASKRRRATIIQILSSGRDNARQWLAMNRANDGYVDISNSNWESSMAVLDSIDLQKIRLAGQTIRPTMVNSEITESDFWNLSTDGHFWGGGNRWLGCSFSQLRLRSVISPQNLFVDCIFKDTAFDGYVACETLFKSCQFRNCSFQSLRAISQRRSRWEISEMANLGSSLQFIGCEFDHVAFQHCVFGNTGFRTNRFIESIANHCDFTGINSDDRWWSDSAQADVFVCYLNEVIAEITKRLGTTSSAVKTLTTYKNEYAQGKTQSKDYSACLYDGSVSDAELDVAEDILDQLGPRFGL